MLYEISCKLSIHSYLFSSPSLHHSSVSQYKQDTPSYRSIYHRLICRSLGRVLYDEYVLELLVWGRERGWVFVCVCVRERVIEREKEGEKERERECEKGIVYERGSACVCVCLCVREKESEREIIVIWYLPLLLSP